MHGQGLCLHPELRKGNRDVALATGLDGLPGIAALDTQLHTLCQDGQSALLSPSTLLDQAHNAIERKLFAMKGFHHPGGSQQAFLTGFAHLHNFIPYQRRALNAGKCGVEVEGGRVPISDWMLNLQILTSGGFR